MIRFIISRNRDLSSLTLFGGIYYYVIRSDCSKCVNILAFSLFIFNRSSKIDFVFVSFASGISISYLSNNSHVINHIFLLLLHRRYDIYCNLIFYLDRKQIFLHPVVYRYILFPPLGNIFICYTYNTVFLHYI